ncbi:MAG: hypothetical protein GY754_26375, partial [bacterium]|nr:hypothetical protein [bacterium]
IREYLDILLMQSTLTEDPLFADNYRDKYFFAARDSGGLQKFVIVWGFPETKELEEYFPRE